MSEAGTYKVDLATWKRKRLAHVDEPTQVRETTTTTGAGPLTLGGAVAGFQAASAVYRAGDVFMGATTDGRDREYGFHTVNSDGTIARSLILGSTAGGDEINWSAGTRLFIANVADIRLSLLELLFEYSAPGGPLVPADIGVTVQAHSDNLDEYAGVNPTAAGLALLDDATAGDQRTTLGLGNVENTALSTWAGSANITTLGTIATGVWNGTTIGVAKGGTGITAGTSGGVPFYSASGTIASSAALGSTQVVLGGGAGVAPNTSANLTFSGAQLNIGQMAIPSINAALVTEQSAAGISALFVNSSALGAASGAGMVGYAKALPTAANQRLGFFLAGSGNAGASALTGTGMASFSEGAWTAGVSHPAYITLETTASGAATRSERWRVSSPGHLLGGADNTYDIGAAGATRPRTGYFGTSLVTPKAFVTTSQSPASGGTGVTGEITWDASFLYVCTATNTWARAALTGGY